LSFDSGNIALGRLQGGGGLLSRSLRLREARFSLLNGGVRFLTFLRRLGYVKLTNGSFVRALNVEGDLLLGLG
jgi:hypothetical protein